MLGKIATHLCKPLLCLLLLYGKRIHTRDCLRDTLFQLRQTLPRIIHLAACILIDVENLCLIVLDRVDRTRQQSAQLPLLEAFPDLLLRQIRISPPSSTRSHRTLLSIPISFIVPHFRAKVTQTCFFLKKSVKYRNGEKYSPTYMRRKHR